MEVERKYDPQEQLSRSMVNVGGKQVPTVEWTLTQMMAQSCRIDRANAIAWGGLALGAIGMLLGLIAIC